MKLVICSVFLWAASLSLWCGDLPAYKIYNIDNNVISYHDMINHLNKAELIFFGELHDNPIAHWLELELTRSLHEQFGEKLALGAEMLESDNQHILDEYLSGLIKTSHFEDNMRLWKNYQTDYKPLVEFARENGLKFIASNIPRRYAGIVAREGFEGLRYLPSEATRYIAPLPIEYDPALKCYADMMKMGGMPHAMQSNNLPKAQAVKDATMAYFIAQNLPDNGMFLHYNGRYHSDNHQSIIWYLNKYAPGKEMKTISCVLADDYQVPEEEKGVADFIIVIPASMTRTY